MNHIRWGRVVVAAVMSEVGVIALLLAVITAYTLLTPAITSAEYASLGEEVGYYVAPTAGAVMTVLSVLWAARTLTSAFILHGVLIGVVSVVLTVGFVFGARPDHRVMYIVAFALRIVGGYAGGVISRSLFNARHHRPTPVDEAV